MEREGKEERGGMRKGKAFQTEERERVKMGGKGQRRVCVCVLGWCLRGMARKKKNRKYWQR